MELETMRLFLRTTLLAKRINDMLPPLPKGVTPRSLHILETIDKLSATGKKVRVSDVASALGITRPSITKVVQDLTELGYVEKNASKEDGRLVHVHLTAKGKELYANFITSKHTSIFDVVKDMDEEEAQIASKFIKDFFQRLKDGRLKF